MVPFGPVAPGHAGGLQRQGIHHRGIQDGQACDVPPASVLLNVTASLRRRTLLLTVRVIALSLTACPVIVTVSVRTATVGQQ
jgi:hypothetical protein